MSIFTKLFDLIKDILPFLKKAAEQAYDKLPAETQQHLQKISMLVEAVKQLILAGKEITVLALVELTQLPADDIEGYLLSYAKSKGVDTGILDDAIAFIRKEYAYSNETGLKALWTSMYNIIAEEFSHIDWRTLLMGVGQFVYDEFVKGKVKV